MRIGLAVGQFGLNPFPHRGAEMVLQPFRRWVEVIGGQVSVATQPGFPEPVLTDHHLGLAAADLGECHQAIPLVHSAPPFKPHSGEPFEESASIRERDGR